VAHRYYAESRRRILRRIERPRIRVTRRAHKAAVDTQRDLEVLLTAGVIEQALFLRSIAGELLDSAMEAFAFGASERVMSGEWRVAQKTELAAWRIARLLAAARVLGQAQVRRDADLPLKRDMQMAELSQVSPAGAVEYLRRLPVMTQAQWERAVTEQQAQAFRIAGVNQQAALEGMRDLIATSLESGLTPTQFERAARELLRNFQTSAGRLRVVWNTNVGQALANGREEALRDPQVAAIINWRLFDAMNDGSTRPNHLAGDNGVAPAAWWETTGAELRPLLGFNCRCVLIGVSQARALKMIESGAARDLREGIPFGFRRDPGFRSVN